VSSYLVTAFKELGIIVDTHGLDSADLTSKMDDKDFDAMLMLWQLGAPPEDPRQLWHSKGAADKGSSNYISFQNSEADQIIEELEYASDPEKRKQLYWRFGEILHEEQPYIFIFTPKTNLLYREYVKNVFIPADRQDLVPGANVTEPQSNIYWIDRNG
jgi:peptide/nickel transport system substrate-binding protein